jgi:hypothetical protein
MAGSTLEERQGCRKRFRCKCSHGKCSHGKCSHGKHFHHKRFHYLQRSKETTSLYYHGVNRMNGALTARWLLTGYVMSLIHASALR